MKRFLRIVALLLLIPLVVVVVYLSYMTATDYKPAAEEIVYENAKVAPNQPDSVLELLIWNIGYAGLGKDMDFFYDGGTQVRTTEELTKQNLDAVIKFVSASKADIIMLQEIDLDAKRSYHIDEWKLLNEALTERESYFATNYKSPWVPKPFTDPLGDVWAGLGSFSKLKARLAVRHAFEGNYEWPKHLAMLDRCFLAQHFPLHSGKELIVINTHNSAYDDGSLKKRQNAQLSAFLETEYAKGNYVIVGGDWNQTPPNFRAGYTNTVTSQFVAPPVASDFMPGWTFAYDPNTPSNRELNKPISSSEVYKEVIDYYLLSPNVQLVEVKTQDLGFANSDHQPVQLKVMLK